ncbi:MAG: hypothetical protein US31_C0004G0019 [Berkelbacteria bacterium GW2011_GWA1_36_9]|uniref:Radical SAM core domain-containing protein n=1 Tax=Berkelbacteria bacterium GW2011_GWA1_36_9 TaxID=1618331 RepID=A0A0G0FKV5_9BACT|nr:MAG: hypothetical protein US31_C0004G0019 [Berkelbacteria bacterium GW2011_GWA1_36_9]
MINRLKKSLPKISFSVLPFIDKPYIIFFNIIERCNLRCSYCCGKYYSDKEELSFSQVKKILTDFYQLGARRLGISGGEALLYKDIDKVIELAVSLGYDVGLNSNGILVPLHLKALRLLSNLSISLDGATAKVHDKYRGKGSFEKAIHGLEAAHKAEIPLHICCTLTDVNYHEWRDVLKLGEKYNASVLLCPFYPPFDEKNKFNLPGDYPEKIKQVIKDIIKEKKRKGNNIFYSEATYKLMLDWPDYKNDISPSKPKGYPICQFGKKIVIINNKGELFPCLRISRSIPGQGCLKQSVAQAYRNMTTPPCKACFWVCTLEYNLLFGLNISAIFNYVNNSLREKNITK